jgi:outer membrane murein-binding lipoprotein Lpp
MEISHMKIRINLALTALVLTSLVCAGCGDSKKKTVSKSTERTAKDGDKEALDPHDVPMTEADVDKLKGEVKSYETAVARIKSYRDTIRDKVAADKPTEAHRALDELDLILGWLPQIAKDSGVPRESWEDVSTSAQTLRDSFNEVHAAIDEKKDPDYNAVSDKIDAAVTKLDEVPKETK